MCSGPNFWSKFRLLPIFCFFVVSVTGQETENASPSLTLAEGELNEVEKEILKIFRPDPNGPSPILNENALVSQYLTNEVRAKIRRFDKNEPFTPTLKKHAELSFVLTEVFLNAPNITVLVAIGKSLNDEYINRGLLIHSLALALIHREDSKTFRIGKLFQMNTSDYLDGRLRDDVMVESMSPGGAGNIDIWRNYTTASDREPEHRLAYFREDLGINLHHWHWHLVYPYEGRDEIVIKDRRGELFYYMHHQIIARYNAERLSNQLGRVKRLNNCREPIPEAYFSKLDSHLASRSWAFRPSGMVLRDIDRPDVHEKFDIADLDRWVDRLYEAIYKREVIYKNGTTVPLDEHTGIDILGNAIEASPNLSPNVDFYGQLHNDGHTAIAFIHDPDGSHMEMISVMGDPATAMRDPIFYRWHSYMNEIFIEHKNTLNPYTKETLSYPDIIVSDVHVIEDEGSSEGSKADHLNTFWDSSVIRLYRGVDFVVPFTSTSRVDARITHLNHNPFSYTFQIENTSPDEKIGIVRIFIGPQFDERGLRFPFDEQKKLMIEMDNFKVIIPPGKKTFNRSSIDSSLTIPFSSTIYRLTVDEPPIEGSYSGCGWPQHMLLPRGSKDGFPMDLFIMVSDDPDPAIPLADGSPKPAFTFCGLRGQKYPEARSMGYPFDRPADSDTDTLAKFLLPNMATNTIEIKFTDAYLGKAPVAEHQ